MFRHCNHKTSYYGRLSDLYQSVECDPQDWSQGCLGDDDAAHFGGT